MKLITRSTYLSKMINAIGTPDIKILTGVRRCGKSKLLEAFKDYIKINIPDANITHINFNLTEYEFLKERHALDNYLVDSYKPNVKNFILIDEIQMCPGFEITINNLHALEKFDIYITGSNAFLMSSDLKTLFTGRTFEIKVFPFSFAEYFEYFPNSNVYEAFDHFLKEGGMAGSYLYKDDESKFDYIADIFDTLIVSDIRQKHNIRHMELMNRVVEYLMDNTSNLTSARNIADVLTSNKDNINHKTVGKYLDYLCNAFAFYKIRRFDIQGRKYLTTNDKYYLSDHAFRYAKLGTKNMNTGRIIENIVAVELLRRGYEVYVGVLYKKEIDFVAIKRSEKIYIQVSDDISNTSTFQREVSSLLQMRDAYPKMIIARTRSEEYQYEGIRVVDVADWLLDKK